MNDVLRTILIILELFFIVFIPCVMMPAILFHWIGSVILLSFSLLLLGEDIGFRQMRGKGFVW